MDTPRVSADEIQRFAELLWRPGDVREVRVLFTGRSPAAGYFNSPENLAKAAACFDGHANLYITLNPVNPALLARAQNTIKGNARETTADADVDRHVWLFLDIDPQRPSGISSTDGERDAARSVLMRIVEGLTTLGWPQPLTAMSGNGWYALYRIDLPADQDSKSLIRSVLTVLHQEYSDEAAHIDTAVHNPSRIAGLIGTLKMKGDSTSQRPHRRSELVSVPPHLDIVTEAQLRALLPEPAAAPSIKTSHGSGPLLTDLLDAAGIAYKAQPPDANGVTWFHIRRCPFHADGRDFECGVGQKLPDGPYAGHGFHPECVNRGWQEWKLALGLAIGPRHLRSISASSPARRSTDFPLTDAGNAELFAHLYGDQLRYDHRRHRWLIWDEHRWRPDQEAEVMQRAIHAVRQRYIETLALDDPDEKNRQSRFAIASENRQRLEALLTLAKSKPPIADAGDSWDSYPWLLGVANGVISLKSGELQPGLPGQRITRYTDIEYSPDAECPRWMQFLEEVFGDKETIDFIWKAVGYSLTGDVSEQCLFTCYGTGSNGKSIFLNVLRDLAGDYAYNAPFSIFELRNRASIPNDVAPLAGARLVTASETNDGTRLNEARLKALTGGDPITARFLQAEFFTFEAQAKFWLAANHKPPVDDQSHGFWRRVRLVPFERTFVTDQDKHLATKLRRELPGILAWAIRGCLAWQKDGLGLPQAVASATETYRRDSDPLGEFVEDCCIVREDTQCGANEAYSRYGQWLSQRGMKDSEKLTSTAFGTRMTERFTKKRSGKGVFYVGVGLLSQHADRPADPTPVQGLVQGSESGDGSVQVFPLEEALTREESEIPYTTLHPTQPVEDACAECGAPPWKFAPDGTPFCEAHANSREGAPA